MRGWNGEETKGRSSSFALGSIRLKSTPMPREPTDIRPCGCLTDSQLIASLTITGTARPVLECARLKSANITPAFLVGVRRGVRAGLYPGDGPAAARLVEDSDMDSYIIAPRCYYLAP